ncbi:hypothetical protein KAI87_07410, partial [Myxococcota bacterium]|nr:hypothetical protein [Myxococcota bacterium]
MNIINNPEKLTDFQAYTPTGDSSHKLDNAEKTTPVDNNISSMSFFDNSSGTVKPYFKVEWSPVEDKGKIDKIFNA